MYLYVCNDHDFKILYSVIFCHSNHVISCETSIEYFIEKLQLVLAVSVS